MLFKRKAIEDSIPETTLKKNPFVVWLEIGAVDLDRAANFYRNVFRVNIKIENLYGNKVGIFDKKNEEVGICLIERKNMGGNVSIKPTFYVEVVHECLNRALDCGGRLISPPELLKQQNKSGGTMIGSNLIDNEIGYLAEILDTEGNNILLYSHY
jgi:predicted enzyme related to lactoylglutathione lyase